MNAHFCIYIAEYLKNIGGILVAKLFCNFSQKLRLVSTTLIEINNLSLDHSFKIDAPVGDVKQDKQLLNAKTTIFKKSIRNEQCWKVSLSERVTTLTSEFQICFAARTSKFQTYLQHKPAKFSNARQHSWSLLMAKLVSNNRCKRSMLWTTFGKEIWTN